MEYLNKVQLRGRVGHVNIKTFGSDQKSVASFSVATEYAYKDRNGNLVIDVTWHNCVAWSRAGLPDISSIEMGAFIELTGRIRTHKYTANDGVERSVVEIIVAEFKILDTKGR